MDSERSLSVILVEPLYPLNVGAVARLCKIFQAKHLILINPKCDHLSDQAKMAATHGGEYLKKAIILNSFEEAKDFCDVLAGFSSREGTSRNLIRTPWMLEDFAQHLSEISGSIGLVFGRESDGLRNDELSLCDFMVTIPINSPYNVLNLSHAVAIALYELHKKFGTPREFKFRVANDAEKERIIMMWNELVNELNLPERRKKSIRLSFKNLVGRAMISGREAHALIGALKEIKSQHLTLTK